MATIGSATLKIVPKVDGLSKAIDRQLKSAEASAKSSGASAGEGYGGGFGGGLVKSGAVIGAASAVIEDAMGAVAGSVGDAASRFDTLNQYPKTMELLGYSAEGAEASISKMSDRLQALPTRLDDMVGTVQGIVAITGDLDQATDAGLALNDMLVASGSSTQLTVAAMEQFRQMLAKGKPELEDWKSLTSAMPGQMAQLAQAMLGPTATANDLYAALGGGKNEAVYTMDELLEKMIELDTVGGEGITSFREQAETAAGGVQTAAANMRNAVVKGIAGTMEAVGKDNIAGAFDSVKDGINDAFGAVNGFVSKAVPAIKGACEDIEPMAGQIAATAASFALFKTAGGHLADFAGRAKEARKASSLLEGANTLLGSSFTPVGVGVGVASAALAVLAGAYVDARKKEETFEKAAEGLSDAVSDVSALDGYSGAVSGVGALAEESAMSVDELAQSIADSVDRIGGVVGDAQSQIADLNTAQGIIADYAGLSDLSADAQGRLQWALSLVNEQFGLQIGMADAVAGFYTDQDGNVKSLKESVNELVAAKKSEIKVAAVEESLTEAYGARSEAAKTLAATQEEYNAALDEYARKLQESTGLSYEEARERAANTTAMSGMNTELAEANRLYDESARAVDELEAELGAAASAASESADAFDAWASNVGPLVEETLKRACGPDGLGMLKDDLRALGASTEDLSALTEDELIEIASVYDGTASSIVGKLDEMGIGMDEAARETALRAEEMESALETFALRAGVHMAGIDVEALSRKLSDAGVSVEDLKAVGSAGFAELAAACNGNIDAMVWALQHYNDTPLLDKDGNVQLDDAELIDAQGNVYVWNGTELVEKSTGASVDYAQVVDGTGAVLVYDGTSLDGKWARAQVDGNAVTGAAKAGIDDASASARSLEGKSVDVNVSGNYASASSLIWDLGNAIGSLAGAAVNVAANVFGHASGGIRLNAEGGIRPRAGGGIATRAVPLDIVGEDGAEAIVPLTNRRYSQPFAEVIAEQVNAGGSSMEAARMVVAWLEERLPSIMREGFPDALSVEGREFARLVRRCR